MSADAAKTPPLASGDSPVSLSAPLPLEYQAPFVGSLAQRTASGFAWTMVQTVATKAVNLAGTVVLAWLLVKRDFAVVSTALAISTFANLIQEAGLQQVLVHRQAEFARWANGAFWMSVVTGLLGAGVMAALALPVARYYQSQELQGLMLVLAIRCPFLSLGTVPTAQLQNELRFKLLSLIQVIVATVIMMLTIALAWGLPKEHKAYAFVLPLLAGTILRAGILWVFACPPIRATFELGLWKNLVGSSGLLLMASFFFTLTSQGDYLTLNRLQSKYIGGIYFFAFNLSLQTTQFFTVNLYNVLFPALSKLQHDPDRLRRAFLRAGRMLMLLGVPTCLIQAALAGPMVRILFPKWEMAIGVLQVICVAMSLQLVNMPALGMIQAQGRFKTLLALSGFCAALFLALVVLAAHSGGGEMGIIDWPWLARPLGAVFGDRANVALVVALAVAVYCAIIGPMCMYVAIRPVGGSAAEIWPIYLLPLALSAIAIGLGLLVCHRLPGTRLGDWGKLIGITLISAAVYVPAVRRLARDSWDELLQRVRGLGGAA